MSKSFEFDAPQYINFSNLNDPNADKFFDNKAEEDMNVVVNSSSKSSTNQKSNIENEEPKIMKNSNTPACKPNLTVLRKVLHEVVNQKVQSENILQTETPYRKNEQEILQKFQNLNLSESKPRKSKVVIKAANLFGGNSARKSHHMITRLDVINQRAEIKPLISSEKENMLNLNSEEQEKFTSLTLRNNKVIKRTASPLQSVKKFVSLAEQVEHFLKDTPDRYKSRPNKKGVQLHLETKLHHSIPKTPKLLTKFRQRKVNFPDEKLREEMELEEMKKHQIKAYPLNEKILMGPSLNLKVPIQKKPATIPQPFSLTEFKKKEQVQEPVFRFKAKPLPATIFLGPVGVPPKKVMSPTVPSTPKIRVPLRFRAEVKSPEKSVSSESLNFPRNTKVEPFSFDSRMQETLKKKQEYIKKVLEEEKKTFSMFRAHPVPVFKTKYNSSSKPCTSNKTVVQPFSLTQPKVDKAVLENELPAKTTPFKAKPATVIHQKPFIPKLPKHEAILPADFHLNTEKRATERKKFDDKVKQKEEELNMILKLQKEEEEKLEKELALEERKKAEFKANPMPNYKPFQIHAADPECLTHPQSPKFSTKVREAKKLNTLKENC